MDFLDRFPARDRDRLLSVATTVRLGRGDFLMRRGERGGDIYRVVEGDLEVIDTRSQPAVVIDVIGRGSVVGEMAFLDESHRIADVRAADAAVVQRWDRPGLLRLLEGDPGLAASFYRVVAALVVDRSRALSTLAMSGTLTTGGGRRGTEQAAAAGQALAEELRARLMEVEPLIRRDRALARRETLTALRNFTESAGTRLSRMSDDDAAAAGDTLGRELHPYVMRSHLGELAVDRPAGYASDPNALAHLHRATPEGDGPLGEFLDEWLLGLPTARAMRERTALAAELAVERVPASGTVRLLLVNLGSGALLDALLPHFSRLRGELVCVDGSRDALALADKKLGQRVGDLRVRLVQDDLGILALGRSRMRHPPQDIVIVDGLADHAPERVASTLLEWVRAQVVPGGHVLLTALAEASDDAVFRWLVRWPLVRHRKAGLVGLCAGVGLHGVQAYDATGVGMVIAGNVGASSGATTARQA